jgi:hypothetical protein
MIPFVDLKPIHEPLKNSFQTVLDNLLEVRQISSQVNGFKI